MQVFSGAKQVQGLGGPSVVALGNFDGLHLGHQALIRRVLDLAKAEGLKSVVYTFDPHPVTVLHPEKNHQNLFTRQDLVEQLTWLGVENLILEPFTHAFAKLSPNEFLRQYLIEPLHPRHLVIGQDFAFGNQRQGSIDLLREQSIGGGFQVQVIKPVLVEQALVSSSRIRLALAAGDVVLARKLLGRPFASHGVVITGAGRGRTIGVPTANMQIHDTLLPKRGVYLTKAWVNGLAHPAVTNVGIAPTFNGENAPLWLETHILDQNLGLVGSRLRLEFISYLREEKRFSAVEELVQQIARDIQKARELWDLNDEMGRSRP
ncbi:MAG: bifunctional riboflavin kinase/FAD synthetase [Bdellovibrionales bacterium]